MWAGTWEWVMPLWQGGLVIQEWVPDEIVSSAPLRLSSPPFLSECYLSLPTSAMK